MTLLSRINWVFKDPAILHTAGGSTPMGLTIPPRRGSQRDGAKDRLESKG